MFPVDKGTMTYVKDGEKIEGMAMCPLCLHLAFDLVQFWCPDSCKNLYGRRCLGENLILGGSAKCPKCGKGRVESSAHGSGPKPWWLATLRGESVEGGVGGN